MILKTAGHINQSHPRNAALRSAHAEIAIGRSAREGCARSNRIDISALSSLPAGLMRLIINLSRYGSRHYFLA